MVASSIQKYKGILYPMDDSSLSSMLSNTTAAVHSVQYRSAAGDSHSPSVQPVQFLSNDPVEAKVLIAMVLALISGIIQVN